MTEPGKVLSFEEWKRKERSKTHAENMEASLRSRYELELETAKLRAMLGADRGPGFPGTRKKSIAYRVGEGIAAALFVAAFLFLVIAGYWGLFR